MDDQTPRAAGMPAGHDGARLASLTDPMLDPLFWQAGRIGEVSAWWRHVPFAHWLIHNAAPRSLVELGTHNGVSYSAFCDAVQRAGLSTRCWAVDTWQGDKHAGAYDDTVYNSFRAFHDARFLGFSGLLRMTFDEALPRFMDGSIDLLHIDGLHTYDAVRHDFESWLPKLSSRGIVLFHDTNELDGDFGVWRLWAELRLQYPSFEFLHGHGLGVLCVGPEVPPALAELCRLGDSAAAARLRSRFAWLGERWESETREWLAAGILEQRLAAERQAHQETSGRLRDAERQAETLEAMRAQASQRAQAARAEMEALQQRASQSSAAVAAAAASAAAALPGQAEASRQLIEQYAAEREQLLVRLSRSEQSAQAARDELQQLTQSTLWRAGDPVRRLASRLPPGIRRGMRGAAKVAWWSASLKLPSKLRERRAIMAEIAAAPPAPAATPNAAAWSALSTAADGATLADLGRLDTLRVVYISGEASTPGHLYRVERPAAAARCSGAQVAVVKMEEIETHLPSIAVAHVLVLWRTPLNELVARAIAAARNSGARVVFDVDDLMIEPKLARNEFIDGIRSQQLTEKMVADHFGQIRAAMLAADMCTTSTEELAAHMREASMPVRVVPNGFDHDTLAFSRCAARRWAQQRDGLLRIGYASGSRTHQKDFKLCAGAVAQALRSFPEARLVLFRSSGGTPTLDVEEFPELAGLEDRIEWRTMVPLPQLPQEMARFDINLAPLEVGNPFCEAKSELKYFEAALVDVPTVASPTGPYRRAITEGETGYLARAPAQWEAALRALLGDAALRRRVASAARRDVLWTYGPEQRLEAVSDVLEMLRGGRAAAKAFERHCHPAPRPAFPTVPEHEVVFEHDLLGHAAVSVVMPLYNYAQYVEEALDSVAEQTLGLLDLIIVDDASTDESRAVALRWAAANANRFNRLLVVRNLRNAGLGLTRNVAFELADTPWVLPLDADNRLRPDCAEACLRTAEQHGVSYAYPTIQQFGDDTYVMGVAPYDPVRLANGNYIDAMALISRAAWLWVGGYDHIPGGWEDFDLWCRFAGRGLRGQQVPGQPLAEYRVHQSSMIRTASASIERTEAMIAELTRRHPWLTITWPLPVPRPPRPEAEG